MRGKRGKPFGTFPGLAAAGYFDLFLAWTSGLLR